ncbi:MAG: hypothetical protein Q9227_005033 [Pyrenula ochraceoflavens]
MAETIGLAASLISLASLFSTCIECFQYYEVAKECPRQVKTKLVKLDFEKTRLLIWANEAGLVSTDARFRNPSIEKHEEQLHETFEQIRYLLAEANKMRERYGLRPGDDLAVTASTTLVSRNSFKKFKTSFRRFSARFIKPELAPSLSTRLKWAIVDESRFEILVKTLREFVDNLFWLVNVERSVQDHIVEEDILVVRDLDDLEMIRDASDHEYQIWSDVASRAIKKTERGTTTDELYISYPPPCEDENFGSRVFAPPAMSHHYFSQSTSSPGNRLRSQFSIGPMTRQGILQHMLKEGEGENFPLATAYIYVTPCERLISQAVCICKEGSTGSIFQFRIRVDDRISATCCAANHGHYRLNSLLSHLATEGYDGFWPFSNMFDSMWIEQRIYKVEVEEQLPNPNLTKAVKPFFLEESYSTWETVAAIIHVGEEAQIRIMLSSRMFSQSPHIPSATEIYAINFKRSNRQYLGKYQRNRRFTRRLDTASSTSPETATLPLDMVTRSVRSSVSEPSNNQI